MRGSGRRPRRARRPCGPAPPPPRPTADAARHRTPSTRRGRRVPDDPRTGERRAQRPTAGSAPRPGRCRAPGPLTCRQNLVASCRPSESVHRASASFRRSSCSFGADDLESIVRRHCSRRPQPRRRSGGRRARLRRGRPRERQQPGWPVGEGHGRMPGVPDLRRVDHLSGSQARRIALAAQGFADKRPTGPVDLRHLRRVLGRVGLIQIDSVNVLARTQELLLFARLGPHPRDLIPRASARRELFEYWAHEASHLPPERHHLLRWRMERARHGETWGHIARIGREEQRYVAAILDEVREGGPLTPSMLTDPGVRHAGHVGSQPGQGGTGVPLLDRAGQRPARAGLRAVVRRARTPPPARCPRRADADRDGRPQGAARPRRPFDGRGHGAGPRRLLPAQRAPVPAAARRARRGRTPPTRSPSPAGRTRRSSTPTPACLAGSGPAPCCRRSTR